MNIINLGILAHIDAGKTSVTIRKGRHTSADKVAVQYFTEAANPDNYIYQ